jgi:Fe-S-cluster-containing hydrogenase component 2
MNDARYYLAINYDKCCGCKLCELACSMMRSKDEVSVPSKSRIQVYRREPLGLDIPLVCLHCEDPPCMVCPVDAMSRDERGAVLVDQKKCIGCKQCLQACPFGAISFDTKTRKVFKCDLCDGSPICERLCNIAHPDDNVLTYLTPESAERWKRENAFKEIGESVIEARKLAVSKRG